MPWSHCGLAEINDDLDCPECGMGKEEWTLHVDQTRTFVVSKPKVSMRASTFLEVQFLLADERPLAGAAFEVELPNSRVCRGELDAEGLLRLGDVPSGGCLVSLPDYPTFVPSPDDAHLLVESGPTADADLECAAGQCHVFHLDLVGLMIILKDQAGENVLPFYEFLLYDGDEEHVLTAESDAEGKYVVEPGLVPADPQVDVIGPGPGHPTRA